MTGLPPEATDLYGLTPGEFVAARNALVKQLKRDKRSDDAAVIGALRRPSPADHAVNAAVRADPDVAVVWVDAVIALDDEQRAAIEGSANHLREAGVALREATAHLVDAAVAAVGDERRRPAVIDALRVAATRPGAALVGAGILGAGDPTDDLFAGMPEPAPAPAKRERPAASPKTKAKAEAKPAPEPAEPAPAPVVDTRAEQRAAAAAARLVAAEDAARIADEELAAARTAEEEARRALHEATATLRRTQTAATKAAAELAAARRAVPSS